MTRLSTRSRLVDPNWDLIVANRVADIVGGALSAAKKCECPQCVWNLQEVRVWAKEFLDQRGDCRSEEEGRKES